MMRGRPAGPTHPCCQAIRPFPNSSPFQRWLWRVCRCGQCVPVEQVAVREHFCPQPRLPTDHVPWAGALSLPFQS